MLPSPRLRPYLACADADAALAFYQRVFGMHCTQCLRMPDGKVGHAELTLPDLCLHVSSEFPEANVCAPPRLGGTAVALLLYVDDVDAVVRAAVEAGATQDGETKDEFFGDRTAKLTDPFGHRWFVHTRVEDVSPEEQERRFHALAQ